MNEDDYDRSDDEEVEASESKIFHIHLIRRFLEGEANTADILLENSANPKLCNYIAVTPCIQTLYYIIDEDRGDGKCAIALGIIANLLLFSDSLLKLLDIYPSISQSVINCMLEESDPIIYSEAFRTLSNIVYFGWKRLIEPYLDILSTLIRFTLCNSLNLRLLAQTFQFLHYFVHEYISNEDSDTQRYVFQRLTMHRTIFDILSQNREVLSELSQESIGSCTGIEYFLLFVEELLPYLQSASAESDDCDAQHLSYWTLHPVLVEVLTQWLFGSADCTAVHWDDSAAPRPATMNAVRADVLSINLKFVALSIVNTLLQCAAASAEQGEATVLRCCADGRGFAQLLGLVEEAMIMREADALYSGCSAVSALLSAGWPDQDRESEREERSESEAEDARQALNRRDECLLRHLVEWIDPAFSLVSLLRLADTQRWLQGTECGPDLQADIVVARCLKCVRQLLCKETAAVTAQASVSALVSDMDRFLSECSGT